MEPQQHEAIKKFLESEEGRAKLSMVCLDSIRSHYADQLLREFLDTRKKPAK